MAYELKLIVVEPSYSGLPEVKGRMAKETGRTEFYCRVIATIDLCAFRGEAIEALDRDNIKQSKADKKHVYYYYESDGNTQVKEDRYGEKRNPIPIAEVLKAVEDSHNEDIDEYRYHRSEWAIGLLKSMIGFRGKKLSVILEGH